MKYLFLDVETTGINPYEHSIIQIAALVQIDDVIQDKIILDVAPIPDSKIDAEALNVTGKTVEEIQNYPSALTQLEVLTQFLQNYIGQYDKKDKFFFLAYNAPFDFDFMRAFFIRQGNKFFGSYFWNPAIDIMTLAMDFLKEKRAEMANFRLSTVADILGIYVDNQKLHDAYYDILLSYEIYKKVSFASLSSSPSLTIPKAPSTKVPEQEFKDSLF